MNPFSLFIFSFVVLNFAIFSVGAFKVFDVSHMERASRNFAACYALCVTSTLGFTYQYPNTECTRLCMAAALLMVSLWVFAAAAAAIRKAPLTPIYSSDMPTKLHRVGPYRWVRHPFYTAYIASFVAAALAADHLIPTVCAVLAIATYTLAARLEEKKFANSPLAADYDAFRNSTGMFLPRLLPRFRGRPLGTKE